MARIIERGEASGISNNDYVLLCSPTLGERKIKASKLGGGSTPILVDKTITENGTYNPADDDADGFSQVLVNVAGGTADFLLHGEEIVKSTDTSSFRAISFIDGKTIQNDDTVVILVRDTVFNPNFINAWGATMRSNSIVFEGLLSSGDSFRCVISNTHLQVTALGDRRREIISNLIKLPESYKDGLFQ